MGWKIAGFASDLTQPFFLSIYYEKTERLNINNGPKPPIQQSKIPMKLHAGEVEDVLQNMLAGDEPSPERGCW